MIDCSQKGSDAAAVPEVRGALHEVPKEKTEAGIRLSMTLSISAERIERIALGESWQILTLYPGNLYAVPELDPNFTVHCLAYWLIESKCHSRRTVIAWSSSDHRNGRMGVKLLLELGVALEILEKKV